MKNWKSIFLISLLMLFFTSCFEDCNPVGPSEPKWIDVEVQYQRVDDNPNCPIPFPPELHPRERDVYLLGLKGTKKMQKVAEDIYVTVVNDLRVNYPSDKYGGLCYEISVVDNAYYIHSNPTGCEIRAHKLWLNGYLMQKIHRTGNKEYLFVRFDENGVPHE